MSIDLAMWYCAAESDWFTRWGLVYPGVWIFAFFWIFAFGACIGSFLNVCIWRIPRGESLSKAASHCTVCGNPIRWYDNIPVISFLILRGRCRCCRTPYSCSYFVVELLCGILTALLVVKTGLMQQSPAVIPARMLLIFFGIACAGCDWRFRVVPDKLTFCGMISGLILAALFPEAWGTGVFYQALLWSVASGIAPGIFLLFFAWVGRTICRQEVLGLGDVKFVVMCGILIGLPGVLFSLLSGSLLASLWGIAVKRDLRARLPLVPFLFTGAVLWIFLDRFLLDWYWMFAQVIK